jgi:flagellar basal body-associated protein FliL
MPPSGKPPVPQKPWDGLSFKLGKKAVLGIIVVIIIVAVVLGAFFLYPMISNGEGVTPDKGTVLTTVPTIIKYSGTVVIPAKTLKPEPTTTYRLTPGNSGARVGL